jgi:hypothetical protein
LGAGCFTRAWLTPQYNVAVWGCLFAALAISLACSFYYLPVVVDDAFISYRYSDRLLQGHGLTWNDGEFVEGYSNLLWVLLVAAGGWVEPNLVLVGWFLGLMANAAVLLALVWAFGRTPGVSILPLAAGLFMLSLSESFAFWGIGGLETALVEALLAWALATTYQTPVGRLSWVFPGVLLGLLSIARPDGLLFGVSIAFGVTLRDGFSRAAFRRAFAIFVWPAVFTAAQISFRLAYYGSIVPNTARAKLAFTLDRLWLGSLYLAQGALINGIPVVIVLGLIWWMWRTRRGQILRQTSVFLIPAAIWLAYIGTIGGDIFPWYRHWMPALICFAFALSHLLAALPAIQLTRSGAFLAGAAVLHLLLQQTADPWVGQLWRIPEVSRLLSIFRRMDPDSIDHPLRAAKRDTRQCIAVGQFLQQAFGTQRPLLAVDAAGCMPYASRLPSLDMLGLNDSHISHHRPGNMGKGFLGHELGDGDYVMTRKPDLMAFCWRGDSNQPCLPSDQDMARTPNFLRHYRLVFFRAPGTDAALWTRIEDGRLGIVRTDDSILIPGFLLATSPGVRASLDGNGNPVALVEKGDAAIEDIFLPPGTWDVSLQTDSLSRFQLSTSPAAQSAGSRPDALRVVSYGSMRSFRVLGGPGMIYAIVARRWAESANN